MAVPVLLLDCCTFMLQKIWFSVNARQQLNNTIDSITEPHLTHE